MSGLSEGDLVLCRSQPAKFMRLKSIDEVERHLLFKTGENEHGDIGFSCTYEHCEDMLSGGYWEIVDSVVVE